MSFEAAFRLERGGFRLDARVAGPAPGVTALFGPSGCGKTTFLRCVAGLERPAGRCRVSGEVWQDDERGVFLPPHRRRAGVVFQDGRLFPHLTVDGNLRYAARRAGSERELPATVELLGLAPLLTRPVATLSGGEAQRVAIGRALLSRPRVLLLDEPMSALDAGRKGELLPYLERLHRELSLPVLYVTHDLDEVVRLADRVVLMEAGEAVAAGPAAEVLARLDLPLARRDDASALLEGWVEAKDEPFGLTAVRVGEQLLRVIDLAEPVGAPVRLRVQARDVSLAIEPPRGSSILNVLPATVAEVGPPEGSHRLVRLDLDGGVTLLSRVTERSRHDLGVAAGLTVYAQIKSVALV